MKKCDCRAVQRSALCRSRRELSNDFFLQNLALIQPGTSVGKFARSSIDTLCGLQAGDVVGGGERRPRRAVLEREKQDLLLVAGLRALEALQRCRARVHVSAHAQVRDPERVEGRGDLPEQLVPLHEDDDSRRRVLRGDALCLRKRMNYSSVLTLETE